MSQAGQARQPGQLHLRAARVDDEAFLRSVYAALRADEIALAGWDAASADAFLRMQFDAQDSCYRQRYPDGAFDVISEAGQPVGRLYVARSAASVHVIDIALLPQHRRRGIGSMLLGVLMDEAARAGKVVTIHVELDNPAMRLYQRLGFTEISSAGFHRLMEWRAYPSAAASPAPPHLSAMPLGEHVS